jgi:peptidoglycan/LPS O-acetylase OafA/YrhL
VRIKQLDILRAVAILLVLGRHPVVDPESAGSLRAVASVWHRFGWTGVDLFFVLSGFLIGGLLFNEHRQTSSLRIGRFLVRRGFKIWPGYIALVLFMLFAVPMSHPDGRAYSFSERIAALAPHFFHQQNYFGNVLLHTWSLAIEEHFYLILPVILVLLARCSKPVNSRLFAAIATVALIVIATCTLLRFAHVPTGAVEVWDRLKWTHLRADSLFFGVFLAALFHLRPNVFAQLQRWRVPLLLFGLALISPMMFLVLENSVFVWILGFSLLYVGYGCVLVAAISFEQTNSLAVRSLTFVGVGSYGIYLWHWHLSGIIRTLAKDLLLGTPTLRWLLFMSLYLIAAIMFGHLMTRVIEIPILKFRDRVFPSGATVLGSSSDAVHPSSTLRVVGVNVKTGRNGEKSRSLDF